MEKRDNTKERQLKRGEKALTNNMKSSRRKQETNRKKKGNKRN